jgi:glycosyltransferase involved in cell wall biosynthesis
MTVRVQVAVRDVGMYGGIGRYVTELAEGIPRLDDIDASVVMIGDAFSPWSLGLPRIAAPTIPLGRSLALLKLPRTGDRVTHFPLHETTPIFAACRGPLVMTIHSVEPLYMSRSEIYGSAGPRFARLPFRMLRSTRRRISRVVTPSAFERDRIAEHLWISPEQIDVIPHGVRRSVFFPADRTAAAEAVRERFGISGPYVLYVGHHQPQKNVARLIKAFLSLNRNDMTLAIAGNIEGCATQYATEAAGSPLVRYLGVVHDDRELAQLYRAAHLFCFPSLHESFGLPALEAMASGCAVIAARGTGLEETVGAAAKLFDPRSVDEIADRLESVVSDDVERERLVADGLERAKRFTWDRSLRAHAETYRRASA